jgi:hypothetical protein
MEKKEVVFDIKEDKKHSVCYKTREVDAAVASIYVMRKALGASVPNKIKITIEEER